MNRLSLYLMLTTAWLIATLFIIKSQYDVYITIILSLLYLGMLYSISRVFYYQGKIEILEKVISDLESLRGKRK